MGMMWCRRILPRRAVGRPDSSRRRLRRVQVPLHHHADAHLTGSSGSTATTSGWPGSRFETRDPTPSKHSRSFDFRLAAAMVLLLPALRLSGDRGHRIHPLPPTPPGGGLVSPYFSDSIGYRAPGITRREPVAGSRQPAASGYALCRLSLQAY